MSQLVWTKTENGLHTTYTAGRYEIHVTPLSGNKPDLFADDEFVCGGFLAVDSAKAHAQGLEDARPALCPGVVCRCDEGGFCATHGKRN